MTSEKDNLSSTEEPTKEVIKNYKDLDQKVDAILNKIKKKKIVKTKAKKT